MRLNIFLPSTSPKLTISTGNFSLTNPILFYSDTALTDIEDTLKKFIKRDDVDIILINQNVSRARSMTKQPSRRLDFLRGVDRLLQNLIILIITVLHIFVYYKSHASQIN